jgi:outer membrane biosynthesis protein TonB
VAKHTPHGDTSFQRSLLIYAGGALGVVALFALVFAGIGALRGEPGDVTVDPVATGTEAVTPTEPPTADETTEPPATSEPTETAAPSEEPTTEPVETETATEEPSAEPSPIAPPAGEVDPASVSIQVLDAVLDDGGAAANRVADELREAGYRVVVVNKAARKYDATTVFHSSADGEPAARQIASQFSFTVVEPKPSNLSSSVDIHLVVGADAKA